jgi:phosphoglycolate phosphatase
VNLVFDLDGTLIDSAPDIHAAANRLLAEEGLSPMTLPQVRGMIGRGVPWLMQQLLAASGQPADPARAARMAARFVAGYEDAVHLTVVYPGVLRALAALQDAGHAMAICTNKPARATEAVLRHLGLRGFFAALVAGDSLPLRKPDPAPLRAAVAALGGGAAVYVGDHEVDAETAAAAGVPFVLYSEGYRAGPVAGLAARAFAGWETLPGLVARMEGPR